MKTNNTFIFFLIILMSLSACGFKSMNKLKQKSYFVQQIELDGDKRIGYTIKNEILLNSSDGAKETIDIGLVIKKKKEVKEKNISNKITSYMVTLNVDLSVINVITSKKVESTFTKSSSYNVAKNHSDTISNEKSTIENLTSTITEDIINFLKIYLNS